MWRSFTIFLVVCASSVCGLLPAAADTVDEYDVNRLGRVAGYLSVCPKLMASDTMLDAIERVRRAGLLKPGDQVFEREQREVVDRAMQEWAVARICDEGLRAFGPSGFEVAGWLRHSNLALQFPVERLLAMTDRDDPADPIRDPLRILAGASVAANHCKSAEFGPSVVALLKDHSIDVDDFTTGLLAGPYWREVNNFARWYGRLSGGEREACRVAAKQYGPGGRVAPGILVFN